MFPSQGSNLRLLHWQVDSLPLSHLGKIDLSIHCTILWNVLCFPQFLNIWMNLRPPSCQFQMCNIAYFISFYFKCEPTLWTLYISVNLRKQKRNISLTMLSEGNVEKNMYVVLRFLFGEVWTMTRVIGNISKFFLQWTGKCSTQ